MDPKSVFNCPARKPLSGQAQWWKDGSSFAINAFLGDPEWNFRYSVIPEPSKIIWVAEIVETNTEWAKTADGVPNWGATMSFRHSPVRSNVLDCDGHAASETRAALALNPASSQPVEMGVRSRRVQPKAPTPKSVPHFPPGLAPEQGIGHLRVTQGEAPPARSYACCAKRGWSPFIR